jgi:hypothetical protein
LPDVWVIDLRHRCSAFREVGQRLRGREDTLKQRPRVDR